MRAEGASIAIGRILRGTLVSRSSCRARIQDSRGRMNAVELHSKPRRQVERLHAAASAPPAAERVMCGGGELGDGSKWLRHVAHPLAMRGADGHFTVRRSDLEVGKKLCWRDLGRTAPRGMSSVASV